MKLAETASSTNKVTYDRTRQWQNKANRLTAN